MIDIIGDIHGHVDALKALLNHFGYKMKNGSYAHPDRKALFVGDYIDRGPQIPEKLSIVKSMTDHGAAIALMGNHEFNAVCFNTKSSEGKHLRIHSEKNIHQHEETIRQFEVLF